MAYQTLQEYLDALVEQRTALNIRIGGVREALGLPPEEGQNVLPTAPLGGGAAGGVVHRHGQPGQVRPDAFFRMSIPEAIKAFLEIMKQPQTPKAIHDGLKSGGVLSESSHFDANVRTALKRLKVQGQVVNTKRGAWGLSDWYSGRSGATLADRPKKGKGKKGKKGKAVSKRNTPNGPTLVKPKVAQTEYQKFVAEQRKAGKTLEQIGPLWKQKKASGS